jgi:3',5'-cyclic-AMP phosphodiesterase
MQMKSTESINSGAEPTDMTMKRRYQPLGSLLLRVSLGLLVALTTVTDALSATLYESSVQKLQARTAGVPPREFSFVVMGDSRDNEPVFRKALSLAKSLSPLFILHGGDYSATGSGKETARFLEILREEVPEIPFFVVLGNHEQRRLFQQEVALPDFTVDIPGLDFRLVAVDNSGNALGAAKLDYLGQQLDGARRLTFVAMHVPPQTGRWNWHVFRDGADELIRLLGERKVTMAFYSHVHLFDRDVVNGVSSIITGGAGAPLVRNGFPGAAVHHLVLVTVKNGKVSAVMKRVPQ